MLSKNCIVALLVIFVNYLQTSQACNGYTMKVNKLQECIPNSILKLENPDVVLDKDCNLIFKGCAIVRKTYREAWGRWRIEKPPMPPMEGETDFCTVSDKQRLPEMDEAIKAYNVTIQCPFAARRICSLPDKKVSIKRYKNLLNAAAGTIKLHVEVDYDVGRTCLDVVATISKARPGLL